MSLRGRKRDKLGEMLGQASAVDAGYLAQSMAYHEGYR